MYCNIHLRFLIQLYYVVACFPFWLADSIQAQDISLFPMDPVVCMSSNITFQCTSSFALENDTSQISFMTGIDSFRKVKKVEIDGKQSAKFTLYNVSIFDKGLQICCTLGEYCNSTKDVVSTLWVKQVYDGDLEPLDPEVCTTHNVTFTCTLDSTPISGNSLGFGVKDSSTNRTYVPVDKGRVTLVNQTMAQLTLYNVSLKTFVKCFYWESFGKFDDTKQLGHTSTITVYPLPEEVEKMNCIVDNYLDGLNCSWDTGTPYKSSTPNVVFHWRIPSFDKTWNECPILSKEYRYCSWSSSGVGDFTMKTIEIQLTQIAECGVNDTSKFTVDTTKIVKPKPVTGLISETINSTCIYVQWSTNESQRQYGKEHTVNVTNKWSGPWLFSFNTTHESEIYVHNKTFCGLHPYTKYTFSVSLLPIGDQAGFFSDPRQTEAMTYPDIPGASPEVVSGGFSWNPQDCKTSNAERRICVPLKPIKPIDQNGQMKGLVVTYLNEQTREYLEVNLAEDLKYVCKSGLLCNTSYHFNIKARNGNGTSKVNSSIEISAFTLGITQPQFIVEAAESTYVTLSWPKIVEANSFMVFWCRNRNGQCQEKVDLNWEEFSGDTTEAVIQIENTNSPQDFLYGVSVLTDQGSSGFSWQDCVYLKNAYPQREVKNLAVSPGPEDNSLVVTWDKLTCQSDVPYIDKYNIRYNKVKDKHYTYVNVSAFGEARKVLYDLERDQAYNVTVRAITKTGQYGPVSKSQIRTPVDKSLTPWESAGIGIGVVVGVIIVVIVVILCMRKYRKTKKSFEDAGHITVLPIDESMDDRQTIGINIVRQNSNDSGYDPMTPTPDRSDEQPSYNDPLKSLQMNPDGYCFATVDNSQTQFVENVTPAVVLSLPAANKDMFISLEQIVADVGFVFNDSNMSNTKTFVDHVDTIPREDETAVKARVKNDSGDSGMSETLAKEMSGTSETDIKIRMHENVDEKNSTTMSSIEVSDYVSAENAINPSSSNKAGDRSLLNRSSLSTISGLENRGFVIDMNIDSKTNVGSDTTSDYVRAQAALGTLSSSDFTHSKTLLNSQNTINDIDNVQNDDKESKIDMNNVHDHFLGDFQNSQNAEKRNKNSFENSGLLLTTIPIPAVMGENLSRDSSRLNDQAKCVLPEQSVLTEASFSLLGTNKNGKVEVENKPLPDRELDSLLNHTSKSSVNITNATMDSDATQNLDPTVDHLFDSVNTNDGISSPNVVESPDEQHVPDYVTTTDVPHMQDNIPSNQNTPKVQTTYHQHFGNYVRTTDQPSIPSNSFDMSNKENEQDPTIYDHDIASLNMLPKESNLSLPSTTSGQTDTLKPFCASNFSVQEIPIPTMGSMENADPLCPDSVSATTGGYVPQVTACQQLSSTNKLVVDTSISFCDNIRDSRAVTCSFPISLASVPVSSNYVSLPNIVQGQTSSVASTKIQSCSTDNSFIQFQNPIFHPAPDDNTFVNGSGIPIISDGYVPHSGGIPTSDTSLVLNNPTVKASPASTTQDISGYVLSTNFPTTSSNTHLQSSSTVGQSYGERSDDPLDAIENNANTTKKCPVPMANGYVDHKFISKGNLQEPSILRNDLSDSIIEAGMAAPNDVDEIRNNNSELESSLSLEDENPEIDNLMQGGGSNGYVSDVFAMERL